MSFESKLRAILRERRRKALAVKGKLARAKAKLRKPRLGEFCLYDLLLYRLMMNSGPC